ncbi:MAG TPA: S41 family peptidase [Candidatus Melainabacteria bacterium]|nr:S41 family peptidase [Candidatus Melainabacteria bacterium]HIN63995.1 S41 family peptidase [Candidatus Obscuribacterales bacterium]
MKHVKRISALLLSAFFVVSMLYQPASGHRSQPVEIYHRAWQLVKDNYYDANMSGKNWGDLEHKYDAQIHTNADAFRFIKAMLETLNDPYTRFLDPRAFQDENDAIDARIVGIGVNLQQKEQRLVVTRTIEGGPAETAGMRAKDEIVEIDGSNAVGITPEQAAEKIRGKAGTPVVISIKRADETKKFNIVRQEIAIHAVSTKFLEGGKIGQITLSTFISNDASKEFRAALAKTANCEGLIVDLRDNPGGLLSNALEIADMLLEKGTIVSTISRHGRHADVASGDPVTRQPIVVLVDEESASASEILAGALKDNNRAKIIGTRTYGKGLVQEINRLPGGAAIHITVSKYLTPDGTDINKVGVKPDVECKGDKDEQIIAALSNLKGQIASLRKPVRTSNLSFSK